MNAERQECSIDMLERIAQFIKESDNIVMLPHLNADGDALGSCFALARALRSMGKKADVLLEEELPYIYGFLDSKGFSTVFKEDKGFYDLAVALDTGDADRLGKRLPVFQAARVTVNIDHHHTNSEFAFINHIDTSASAVGEIIYDLLALLGLRPDAATADAIYTAIATDTGGFRYSNTTARTHIIASELIKAGADISHISQMIFDTTSLEKARLIGRAISSLEMLEGGRISVITLSDADMRTSGAREEDCDGIVNIARNVRGVEVAVMLRLRDSGEMKVNLRSREYVDVSAIAGMFGGGGHKRAAGCTIEGKKAGDARKLLIKEIQDALYSPGMRT